MRQPPSAKTVLLVEDDCLLRMMIGDVLEQQGYAVLPVDNGEAALNVMIDGPQVDALVTDVNVPGSVSGWAVAQWFSVLRPGRPVIYASGAEADPKRQVENSVFMSKPFRPTQLVEAVAGLAS